MSLARNLEILLAALALALLTGCERAEVKIYNVPKEAQASTGQSPAAEPSVSDIGGKVVWTKPSEWEELAPTAFRQGNFVYRSSESGTVEISVSAFPGSAGGLLANVNRWRGQASLGPVTNSELRRLTQPIVADGKQGSIVDLKPDSEESSATRIVAAIFESGGQSWFFKMSGPQELVSSQLEVFRDFVGDLEFVQEETAAVATETGESQSLHFQVPEGWVQSEGSRLRIASYRIEHESLPPADFSVTSFPGDSGGTLANVNRWRRQIGLQPWDEETLQSRTETVRAGNLDFILFDLRPEATEENVGTEERILAAILKEGNRSWFFKLRGDAFLLETQEKAFRQILASSHFDAPGAEH